MDFKQIEEKWQRFWEEHSEMYRASDDKIVASSDVHRSPRNDTKKPKKYVLVEFPYPSGSGLHIGHAFSFTGADVYARFKRMQGYNVMFPMGWDAFGLPTENYAIKMKRKPAEVTKENTDMFRSQMKKLAFSFDWSREVNTTDPNYYKWTQWIFIQLFKKGLAYKQEMPINWCPSCKVGLANEEVIDSKCERCGTAVERRTISQWVVKITDYADRLLKGLEETDFVDKVKMAQINWIGKKEGINIDFEVIGTDQKLTVFTTTPVNWGATFLVVAPEHQFVRNIVEGKFGVGQNQVDEIKKYMQGARKKSDMERTELNKEKTGVFTGLYALNHVTGNKIPIWVTDFVLATVGTGAVQGCPGHDQRDWDFAKKYGLPIVRVVSNPNVEEKDVNEEVFVVHAGSKGEMVNSDFLNGIDFTEAMQKTMDYFVDKGWGKRVVSYHLRDWIFSRQHYWGEPIPMVYCEKCAKAQTLPLTPSLDRAGEEKGLPCQGELSDGLRGLNSGWHPVPEEQLPIKLPDVDAYEPTDDGKSPLSKISEWVKTTCPVCGGEAVRETDTMPNWAGSDWYYLAYCFADKINAGHPEFSSGSKDEEMLNQVQHDNSLSASNDIFSDSQKELKKWLPVDIYVGGDEHNTLHMLYSRFIHQFLFDLGVVPTPEPYYRRMSHGVILASDNNRMSKSKGNVIVPETVADKYGVDVIRMYLMFMGPFEGTMAWNENTLMGVKRFLDRFEMFVSKQINQNGVSSKKNVVLINRLVKEVGEDMENFGFNTAIAKQMKALNSLEDAGLDELKVLVRLLAPLAPYLTEELWALLHSSGVSEGYTSVHAASWPEYDEKVLITDTVIVAVAINGKVRDQLRLKSVDVREEKEILDQAKKLPAVQKWIGGKEIVKEIYVPGKMVNLVVNFVLK
jgi:leucyl-tRNA synthetase